MKILVLSPHTDDAELGAGGSICRLLEEGNEICWIVFSTAEESVPEGMEKSVLRDEFNNVMKSYGIDESRVKVFNYPVRSLHASRQEILEEMIRERNALRPDVVIGPSLNDFHQDHQIVANEMIRSFKTSASILCYELPWNHISFETQLFIRLERRHIEKKMKVLEEYKSQIVQNKPYFCREFTAGLARTRGVQSNSEYAEAFEVIRWRI